MQGSVMNLALHVIPDALPMPVDAEPVRVAITRRLLLVTLRVHSDHCGSDVTHPHLKNVCPQVPGSNAIDQTDECGTVASPPCSEATSPGSSPCCMHSIPMRYIADISQEEPKAQL